MDTLPDGNFGALPNKGGGEDVAPGSQPEEENTGDNGDDTNKGGVQDAQIAKDHVARNNKKVSP
ncbi:hypothetical protein E2562_009592 [Oryza meyeriana var. granulata]|uniref:Uncharacterized protein n=1 Tax=Oryza meyeriana var. granulata TaxID=110450 RepID=A0A6G1F652_9ORYZ|nr:hypothetical protein E2562_009592 [Oryza meyeriana var. granulata]